MIIMNSDNVKNNKILDDGDKIQLLKILMLNKHMILLVLNDKIPNIINNDNINSSSNIRRWNITIQ